MIRAMSGIPALALVVLTLGVGTHTRINGFTDPEVARLQQHFKTVEAELLSRDVSGLSPDQRAARQRNIEALRDYARRGVFPHNHDFASPMPYFQDQHGSLCAMAYLVARSGREDLVDKVARSANNAYLPELARDPQLQEWLIDNGLTVAEAARIQPAYPPFPPIEEAQRDAGYEIASVGASVLSGGAITWTLVANPRRAGYLPGFVTSVVGLGDLLLAAGGALTESEGSGMSESEEHLITLNTVVGSVTLLAGITYIVRVVNARSDRAQPATETSSSLRLRNLDPVLGKDADGRTRVGVSMRF